MPEPIPAVLASMVESAIRNVLSPFPDRNTPPPTLRPKTLPRDGGCCSSGVISLPAATRLRAIRGCERLPMAASPPPAPAFVPSIVLPTKRSDVEMTSRLSIASPPPMPKLKRPLIVLSTKSLSDWVDTGAAPRRPCALRQTLPLKRRPPPVRESSTWVSRFESKTLAVMSAVQVSIVAPPPSSPASLRRKSLPLSVMLCDALTDSPPPSSSATLSANVLSSTMTWRKNASMKTAPPSSSETLPWPGPPNVFPRRTIGAATPRVAVRTWLSSS